MTANHSFLFKHLLHQRIDSPQMTKGFSSLFWSVSINCKYSSSPIVTLPLEFPSSRTSACSGTFAFTLSSTLGAGGSVFHHYMMHLLWYSQRDRCFILYVPLHRRWISSNHKKHFWCRFSNYSRHYYWQCIYNLFLFGAGVEVEGPLSTPSTLCASLDTICWLNSSAFMQCS